MVVVKPMLPADWPHRGRLPLAWIVEGTATLQCLCPYCDYAKGYNQSIALPLSTEQKAYCPTCGNEFLALVMPTPDGSIKKLQTTERRTPND